MSSKNKATAEKEVARPALVPKLRFPKFREAKGWREKTFGELLDDIIDFRGRTPIKLGMEWGNGNITSLSANNVKNGFIDYKAECNLGSEELYQRWMGDVSLEKNDIVFTMEAPLGNALLLPDSRKYILSQRVVAFKTNSEVVNPFLVQLIWSDGFQDAISELATGSTAKGINQKALKTVPVKIPHRKEQQKIAECLSSVDELIAAQARKLDALKTHKNGLMQQLFPREGKTQPRLRLPEFQNAPAWEVKPLGKVAENLDNQRIPITSGDRNAGNIPYYGASGIVDYVEGFIFDEDLLCVSEDGANLVARTYPIAFPISGKTWVNNHAHVLRFENACTQKFVEVYLNSIKLDDFITGMAQPKLNKAMLDRIPIPQPRVPEQQRIADCLSSLDNLITAEIHKLEALKAHKSGLMQQLFVINKYIES